jgi:hypothetical protein
VGAIEQGRRSEGKDQSRSLELIVLKHPRVSRKLHACVTRWIKQVPGKGAPALAG